MDVSWVEVAVVVVMAFAAALTQSTVGFGAAIVFTPVASFAVGAQSAVATSIIFGSVISTIVFLESRPRAALGPIAPLAVAGVLGTPIGVWILAHSDETTLRLLVGTSVLAGAITTMFGHTNPEARPAPLPLTAAAGLVSGTLRGATSMGGPPVVLYLHWLGGDAMRIRSQLFAYFVLFAIPGIPLAWIGGVIGMKEVVLATASLPAVGLGILVGRSVRGRLSDVWYRRTSMGLLVVTSSIAITGAVMAIV